MRPGLPVAPHAPRPSRGRWAWGGGLAIAAFLASASSAVATEPVAISPSVAVGAVFPDPACPASRAAASSDRGETWMLGACLGSPTARLDPTPAGGVTAEFGGRVLRINPDATLTVFLETGTGQVPGGAVGSADGQGAFAVLGTGEFAFGAAVSRFRPQTGWQTCPTQPALSDSALNYRLARAGEKLALFNPFTSQVWLSPDGCQTWMAQGQTPPGARLASDPIGSEGQLYAEGGASAVSESRDGGLTWSASDPVQDGGGYFIPADASGRRFVAVDRFASSGYPAGWAMPTPTPPSAAQAGVFAFINERYRRPMGLPDISFDARLARAGQNHIGYWAANGPGAGLAAHTETPGRPGFSGASPSDRCRAVGVDGCGEIAFPGAALDSAVRGWLLTPFHGAPLVYSRQVGFGTGAKGSVGELNGEADAGVIYDLDAPLNSAGAPLRLWPADGMTGVPTRWTGGEVPDPLTGYAGDHADVGPILFVRNLHAAVVTLRGPRGPVSTFRPGDARARPSTALEALSGMYLFAAEALEPRTAYTLSAVMDGRTYVSHFTTAAGSGQTARCRVAVRLSAARRLGISRSGACARVIVQGRLRGRWVGLRAGHRLGATKVRWRAVRSGRTLAQGVARAPVRAARR